jgi:hypothetical protein
MERDTGKKSMGQTNLESRLVITRRSERAGEISVNFEKYEGKIKRTRAGSIGLLTGCAREI